MTVLAGCHQVVCLFLSVFLIPLPPMKLPRRLSSPNGSRMPAATERFKASTFSFRRH
jgi:hypothetical protein